MKSFLDRLRRKSAKTPVPETGGPSPSPQPAAVEKTPKAEVPPAPTATPASSAPPAAPPPLPTPKPAASVPEKTDNGHSIELQIGDFLDRIPPAVLKEGTIDRTLPLRFDLPTIARQFTHSQPTIPLSEIFKRQPGVFRRELAESCGAPILLPWKKVIDMLQKGKSDAATLPPAVVSALTRSLQEQRAAHNKGASSATPTQDKAEQNSARAKDDGSTRSWFSPKSMPGGALTTLPSTLRPPPTAADSLRRSKVAPSAAPKPAPAQQNGSTPQEPERPAETQVLQVLPPPSPPPARPSVVLGEQLAKITTHFDRLVQQLDETSKAQAPVRAQRVPGLEILIEAADQKVAKATQERDAMVDLKSHLDSQFEALSFAQSGIATLQETLEAQSGEFTRMQQVLQSVEEQLTAMTSERDALAEAKAKLAGDVERLSAARVPELEEAAQRERALQDRVRALEARLAEQRPATLPPAPALARLQAARTIAHRIDAPKAGGRGAKSLTIYWPAHVTALNAQQQAENAHPIARFIKKKPPGRRR